MLNCMEAIVETEKDIQKVLTKEQKHRTINEFWVLGPGNDFLRRFWGLQTNRPKRCLGGDFWGQKEIWGMFENWAPIGVDPPSA